MPVIDKSQLDPRAVKLLEGIETSELLHIAEAIKIAGFAHVNRDKWRRQLVELRRDNKLSRQAKTVLKKLANTANVEAVLDSFLELMPKCKDFKYERSSMARVNKAAR